MRWTQARAHRNVLRSDGTPLVREEADPVDRQPNPLQVELHDETLGGPNRSLAKACLLLTAHGLVSHRRHVRQSRVGQLKGRELDLVEHLVDPRQVRSLCLHTLDPCILHRAPKRRLGRDSRRIRRTLIPQWEPAHPAPRTPGPVHSTFCPR